jgi:translocation and assembly module TamA
VPIASNEFALRLHACLRTGGRHASAATRGIAGALLCALSLSAHATYRVEIDAPKPLQGLLSEFLDLVRYKDRTDLDAAQIEFMISTLPDQVTKLASTEGYFTPKTVVRVDQNQAAMTVHVTVDPGKRTTVSKLDLNIVGPAEAESPQQVDAARAAWRLPQGAPFRQDDWTNSKQETLRVLRTRRYAAAELRNARASINPELSEASLEADYDTGPVFTMGPLTINGTLRYPEQIVRNINPLRPGEQYSEERLLELQRLIQRTPYFSNAVIEIARDRENPLLAPVNVRVTEFPTQQIRGGAGYTTDTGAHVDGVYAHNNVFGKAWVFEGQARIEQRLQFGALNLSMPPDGSAFVNNIHASFERTTLQGVDLRSRRAGLRRARSTDKADFAYTVEYYNDQLRQVDGATLPPDTIVQPGSHQAVVAGVAWTRRQLDNLLFPRDGNVVSAELGAALKGLLTDQTFVRAYGRAQKYFPVGVRDVVLLRAELGAVVSKGGNSAIPASLLFRAGGTDSVRGYSYRSIGNESNGTVYPTRYLATGSAEYQHWLNEQWGAAAFYDVGTATDNWKDKQFFQAIGGGARWRSPVGTINADLGYGLQRHQIRPHLSLGVAF